MKRAVTSLPVPLSPRIITVASVAAARRHFSIWSSMAGLRLWAASASPRASSRPFSSSTSLLQLGVGERPLHHQQQVLALEGLLQVIEGAVAHGQHRALHRTEGGEEDDGQSGMGLMQPGKDLFARHARHAHVQQHQVGRVGQAFGQALCRVDENRDTAMPGARSMRWMFSPSAASSSMTRMRLTRSFLRQTSGRAGRA